MPVCNGAAQQSNAGAPKLWLRPPIYTLRQRRRALGNVVCRCHYRLVWAIKMGFSLDVLHAE
jgi:hypothetical protein